MSKKILVVSTIECTKVKSTIFDALNVREDRIKLESCFDKIDLHGRAQSLVGASFDEYISNTESFEEILNDIFNIDTYRPFLDEFTAQNFDVVVVPFSHLLVKPEEFDLIVGYAVPESLYDIDHFSEHEGVNPENAKKLMDAHSNILRSNADNFDVFIDGKTLDEALQIIRAL